ncbi:MBOAT family O-acyltransferase, partial [Bacillus velezensis]|uniref:MBOAT family O-acyltransferase n=2 Tax=Bacteria TaxID=2 RepID=UPI0034D24328
YTPLQMLAAVYAYAWQIYFNFSGYTNLVTGLALLLGFYVPKNFDAPYVSLNLQEFWKRWHISLSTFIRDYIYIPLGGNRHGFIRKNANL